MTRHPTPKPEVYHTSGLRADYRREPLRLPDAGAGRNGELSKSAVDSRKTGETEEARAKATCITRWEFVACKLRSYMWVVPC